MPASTAPLSRPSLVSYTQLAPQQLPTTPRPRARHALEGLYDQDSVVGSGGFDGMYDEGDSDGFDY
jgi:hypothetical protein